MFANGAASSRAFQWAASLLLGLTLVAFTGSSVQARYRRSGRGRSSAAAAAARRQATIQQAQAQIAAAQSVLSAAEYTGANAQARLHESLGKLQAAASETEKGADTENDLRKELAEIEKEILSEQSVDTAYYKAQQETNAANKHLVAVKTQLLARPEVVSKLAGLQGVALTNAQHEILETELAYTAAHTRLQTAGRELEHIKSQLFHADTDWKQTSEALADVRHDISLARQQASAAGFSRLKPLQEYRKASDAAAAARSAIAQAEGVLAGLKATSKSGSSSNAKKK